MSFGNSPNIPRLPDEKQLVSEESWRPYKREILFAVQSKGLTGYIDGTIPKPNAYPGPIYLSTLPPTPLFSPTPCLEEWEARDRLVAGAITSNITDPVGLGVDETKRAHEIWQALIKRFEKRDKQRIHLADTNLRNEKFDPPEVTMEDHERKMRNLLKKVHDLGGTATDAQFRWIVISSMPQEWRQDVRSVPGTSSADAFAYLHTLWYEKEEEWREEERDTKHVKALMAAHSHTSAMTNRTNLPPAGSKAAVICHNCSKPGHIARKCWAKGGGMEGQWPKQNSSSNTKTNANATMAKPDNADVSSPMATYVMSAKTNYEPSRSESVQKTKLTADLANRQDNPILGDMGQREAREWDVDSNLTSYIPIPKGDCTNTQRYRANPGIALYPEREGSSRYLGLEQCNLSREYNKARE
ncbi:hypothetical protein F5877DRAFT_64903 [Lentinula edodes]|nr:hypothetical protein F5877DRAFT_64903 [Lentinula edodes]